MRDMDKPDKIVAKIEAGGRITPDEALVLAEAPLALLGRLAAEIKKRKSGDEVYYNRNFHIEPTNICIFECAFCSYRRPSGSPEAWEYGTEEILDVVQRRKNSGATEIHITGGVHPQRDINYYVALIRAIKNEMPQAAVKAFSAVELFYMIRKAGLSLQEGLGLLKNAGMDSIPGGGAEIFAEEIRSRICPGKCTAGEWLGLHEEAHRLGLQTNATMLYGHIENWAHRIDHLARLRELQDRTSGFSAFIPLKFRSMHNAMSGIGEVGIVEDMRTLALSRIFLDNFPHIKAYWAMYGKTTTEMALAFGADDVDGTIDDSTKIYSMAGAEDAKPSMTTAEMEKLIRNAGYVPVDRDTFYNPVKKS